MKLPFIALLIIITLAGRIALTPLGALAANPPSQNSPDHTSSGGFQTSAGIKGTYEETVTVAGPVATDIIVYTSSDGTETSTVATTTTKNTDGTVTVAFSAVDFEATTAFTSTTTYSAAVDGSAVGTGVYTAADGSTGTLTAINLRTGLTESTSTNFTSAAGALTREHRLEERGGPGISLKVADVNRLL